MSCSPAAALCCLAPRCLLAACLFLRRPPVCPAAPVCRPPVRSFPPARPSALRCWLDPFVAIFFIIAIYVVIQPLAQQCIAMVTCCVDGTPPLCCCFRRFVLCRAWLSMFGRVLWPPPPRASRVHSFSDPWARWWEECPWICDGLARKQRCDESDIITIFHYISIGHDTELY